MKTFKDFIIESHVLTSVKNFVKPYNPQIKSFRDLSKSQRAALIVYMEGGKWDDVLENVDPYPNSVGELLKYDHLFVQKYGSKKFGVVTIPTKDLIEAIQTASGEQYPLHKVDPTDYPSNDWPVILGSDYFTEEVLQDGWHRLNVYFQRGLQNIPCLFYV